MSDADIAEILRLPPEERMRLAEIIWASLVSDPASVPVGEAQRAVIDERLAEHERNPDDVISRVVLAVLHTARDPKVWPRARGKA